MDGLRGKSETGKKLTDAEQQMLVDYETVVIKLETMRLLLEAFEYDEMPSSDTGKDEVIIKKNLTRKSLYCN
jgi:hypothetical protein